MELRVFWHRVFPSCSSAIAKELDYFLYRTNKIKSVTMDEFPLEIRDSPWDMTSFCLVSGTIILNWIMLIIYLVVRTVKRRKSKTSLGQKKIPSKADRPFYITGLVFAATNWMIGTLFTTGTISIKPELQPGHLPAVMIYIVQYLFGALLWIWMTVDRMLWRYASVRFAGETKVRNSLILRFTLALVAFIPFLILGVISISLDKVEVNGLGVTDQDDVFEILMVVYHGILALGITFLVFKIRKIIGNFHEMIRYTVFVLMTLLFFVYDACTTLIHALQNEETAQRVMVFLVWTITTGLLYWVFVLALKPRKNAKTVEDDDVEMVVRKKMTDAEAIDHFIDEDSCGANVAAESSIYDEAKDMLWYIKPRLRLSGPPLEQPFIDFIRRLPKDLLPQDAEYSLIAEAGGRRSVKYRPLAGLMTRIKT